MAVFGIFSFAHTASALSDMYGSAWSGNIGWITFNCLSTSTCGPSNSTAYKVILNDQNKLDGYAWSDNVGWVRFDPNLSSCPGGTSASVCAPRVIYSGAGLGDKYTFYGFAKVLSGNGSTSAAGFSGFIDLNGLNTGSAVSGSRKMLANSYAWGSDLIGWIDMSDVSVGPPSWSPALTINLTANKQTLSLANAEASRVLISYSATPAPGGTALTCNRSKTVDGVVSPNTTWNTWNVTNTAAVSDSRYYDLKDQPYTTTYSINCRNSLTNQTASASIIVGFAPEITLASSTPQVPYYFQSNLPVKNPITLSWTAKHSNSCTAKKVINGSDVSDPVWTGTIWTGNSSVTPVSGTKAVTYDGNSDVTYVITCVGARPDLVSSKSVTITIAKPAMTITATATVPSNNTTPVSAVALPSGSTTQTSANQVLLTWNMTNFQYSGGVSCNGMKRVSGVYTTGAYDFLNIWGFGYIKTPPSIVYGKYGSSNPYVSPTYTAKSQYVTAGPADAEYIITCTNNATRETATASVFVPVTGLNAIPMPSITSFTATPPSFTASSGVSGFYWTAVYVSSCKLDRISPTYSSVSSGLPAIGNDLDTVTANSKYQLSCTNGINTVTKTVDVTVGVTAPPSFGPGAGLKTTALNNSVPSTNRNTGLYWASTNASAGCDVWNTTTNTKLVTRSAATANRVSSSALPISVAGTGESYLLECFNSTGSSVTSPLTISVVPPTPAVVGFGVGSVGTISATVAVGSPSRLVWNVTGASSCSPASPGPAWNTAPFTIIGGATSGVANLTLNTLGNNQPYTLSCVGLDGITVPVTVRINVVLPTPTVTAWALPVSAKIGENVRIYWTSTDATSCAISNHTKGVSVASNQPAQMDNSAIPPDAGYAVTVADPGSTTFRVACSNSSFSNHDDVPVNFDPLTKKIKVIER